MGLFYRPSCYECKYANQIEFRYNNGRFWGVEKLIRMRICIRVVSVLLANTVKGHRLVQKLNKQMKLDEVDINYVIESNAQLNRQLKCILKEKIFIGCLKQSGLTRLLIYVFHGHL